MGSHVIDLSIIPTSQLLLSAFGDFGLSYLFSFYGFSTEWQLIDIMQIVSLPMIHTGEMVISK